MELQQGKGVENLLIGNVDLKKLEQNKALRLDLPKTIQSTREALAARLSSYMNAVRQAQPEDYNPSNPKKAFGKNLLADLDATLGNLSDMEDGRYELRFYSAKDTPLDYFGSFDCWVEIFDTLENRVITDYKIDITSNPEKKVPANLANEVLYFNDNKYLDISSGKEKIDRRFFESPEYKELVLLVVKYFRHTAKLKLAA